MDLSAIENDPPLPKESAEGPGQDHQPGPPLPPDMDTDGRRARGEDRFMDIPSLRHRRHHPMAGSLRDTYDYVLIFSNFAHSKFWISPPVLRIV